MSAEKTTCPTCGSVVDAGQRSCDICGEDLVAAAERRESASKQQAVRQEAAEEQRAEEQQKAEEQQNEDAPARKTASAPATPGKPKKASAGKKQRPKGSAQSGSASSTAHSLFTTTQWIVLCVASFVLGGVITASVLPTGDAPLAQQATSGQSTGDAPAQQQPQIDFARLEEMRKFIDENPEDDEARLRYANDLHDAKLLDQAIAQYKSYLERNPHNPDARVDLGICYFEERNYSAAIAEMERAVADAPEHQLGNYNLGIVNLNAGNLDEARKWFTRARDIDPTSQYGINAGELLKTQFEKAE
ncbi:tetratricopeptide repeat protein [bacterium]|nr:tetratricopeptide repeat protein [bacterium]